MRLYDNTATTSITYNDYQGANEYGIITRSLEAGTYYLEVYQGYTSEATPSYLLEAEFEYSSTEPFAPMPSKTTIQPQVLHPCFLIRRRVTPSHREGDVDFFSVNLDSLSRISVEATGDVSLLEITLLNQEGQELVQATKGSGDNVILSAEFLGAGTYWLRVQNQVPRY